MTEKARSTEIMGSTKSEIAETGGTDKIYKGINGVPGNETY